MRGNFKQRYFFFILISFGTMLISSMLIVLFMLNSTFNQMTEDDISARLRIQSNKINDKFTSVMKVMNDHANNSTLINPLMQFDKNNLAMINYLSNLSIIGYKGDFSLVTFDHQYLYGSSSFNKDDLVSIFEGEAESIINLVDSQKNEFQFLVPMKFAGSIEGAFIFNVSIPLNDLLTSENENWNYTIKQNDMAITAINKSISNEKIETVNIGITSGVVLQIHYDPYTYLKKKSIFIVKIFTILAICVMSFGYYFYRKGEESLVGPHEELIDFKNKLMTTNAVKDSLINSSPLIIIGTDNVGVIKIFNKAAEDSLGYKSSEVIDIHSPALIHKGEEVVKEAETLSEKYGRKVEAGFDVFVYEVNNGKDSNEKEWTYIRKDGSEFKARLFVSPMRDDNGDTVGYLGIAEDVTMINLAREMEVLAKKELEKTAKMKSEFLANMSHEIRTPMNGVLGMVDMLKETDLSNDQRDMLNTMDSCGHSLLTLLNDILDISKIDSGKLEFEEIEFDLNQCIRESIELSRSLIRDKNIEVEFENPISGNSFFKGDVTRIRQIVTNYLSNGLKFTEDGKVSVRLEFEDLDKEIVKLSCYVSDTGIGLSEFEISKLFKSFSQSDSSTTRKYGGTGLGLAICSELAKGMGGDVSVKSEKGRGSTFGFTIPLQKSHGIVCIEAKDTTPDDKMAHEFPHTILVAEDNKVNQKLIGMILSKMGYEIDIVENGQEAINKILELGESHYSLILMDLHMPELDGLTTTRELVSMYKGRCPRIVALTANVFSEDKEKCYEAGMSDFLSKPIVKSEIIRVLKSEKMAA